MLQIISGRFFGDGKVNECETDAILYSNYSWIAPIKTTVAELRPVDAYGSRVASYVLRYTNRYQPHSPNDPLVLAISGDAVEHFRLLASFYFQSYFHVDRSYVESLSRTQARDSFDRTVPKVLVPRFFDLAKTGTNEEAAGFVSFVDKILSMPRRQYLLLMSCLAGFFESLEAIGKNFDLAYSVMVYMLEALSKSVEQPKPVWNDYDQNLRGKLDKQLDSVDPKMAEGVRAILLDNPHLKLKKRFVNFISTHVSDAYFTSDAVGLRFALAKSELARSLGNLYDARSGYVHELKQVQVQLRLHWVGGDSDVFHWMNEPHLTFAGLVRLSRHVLMSFIERQPMVEHEDYLWREELPGRIQVAFAPEYWAGRVDGFEAAQARQRFSGFIEHFVTNASKHQTTLLDLRQLMERIEVLAPAAKANDRLPMLALYWMFNGMIPEEDRRPNWYTFLGQWKSELEHCSIEVMTMFVISGHASPWPAQECARAFERYQSLRHRATATHLPRLAEIAVMGGVTNLFLDGGDVGKFEEWVDRGIHDAAGLNSVQKYLQSRRDTRQRIDTGHILGRATPMDEGGHIGRTNAPAMVNPPE
ncbi:MAG: hypothetical protein JWN24_489 [Phycisphaerales bacterium]|nr:hypothetical protein [Phycisphaerales bacterium]